VTVGQAGHSLLARTRFQAMDDYPIFLCVVAAAWAAWKMLYYGQLLYDHLPDTHKLLGRFTFELFFLVTYEGEVERYRSGFVRSFLGLLCSCVLLLFLLVLLGARL